MGFTEKTNYLKDSKEILRNALQDLGADIDAETPFRQYMKDNIIDTIWNNAKKVSAEGSNIVLQGAAAGKLAITPKGNIVQTILPSEYQQVEYIESSGTQYIDTGYQPSRGDEFTFKNISRNTSNSGALFSAGDGTYQFILLMQSTTYYKYFSSGAAHSILSENLSNIEIKATDDGKLYYNNEFKIDDSSATRGEVDSNLFLFKRANDTSYASAKMGEIIIKNNDNLVRDFIPCYRKADNEIGLYDLVTNVFFINQGTGTFEKGKDIPNPDYPQDIKVVTGDNTVKISGVNLIDENNLTALTNINNITNKIVTSNSLTNTGSAGCNVGFPELNIETGDYYISADIRLKSGTVNSLRSIQLWTRSSWTVSASWVNKPSLSNEFQRYVIKYTVNNIGDISNTIYSFYTQLSNPDNAVLEIKNIQISRTNVNYEPYIQPIEKELNLSSKNLFNKQTALIGKEIQGNTIVDSSNWVVTDYIKVKPNTHYIKSGANAQGRAILLYDKNYNYINRIDSGTDFITPNNSAVEYIITNFPINYLNTFQLEEGSTATEYEAYYAYELAKIGDYSDFIFKNEKSNPYYDNTLVENAWYKKKIISSKIYDETANFQVGSASNDDYYIFQTAYRHELSDKDLLVNDAFADKFVCVGTAAGHINANKEQIAFNNNAQTYLRFTISATRLTEKSISAFQTWLSSNNVLIYYVLANPVNIQITDTTLINQLEEINKVIGQGGTIIVETESDNSNAQLIVNASALQKI